MDRAGCLFGLSYEKNAIVEASGAPAGVLIVKVTQYELDYEIQTERSLLSTNAIIGTPGPSNERGQCTFQTGIAAAGGVLKATGFVDPASDIADEFLLNRTSRGFQLQDTTFLLDVSEFPGVRSGYYIAYGLFLPIQLRGRAAPGQMQELDFEIHSECLIEYATDL